jgi:hypothetical protein
MAILTPEKYALTPLVQWNSTSAARTFARLSCTLFTQGEKVLLR